VQLKSKADDIGYHRDAMLIEKMPYAAILPMCRFYKLFLYNWQGYQKDAAIAHTYFLWALLEQRQQKFDRARKVFWEAVQRWV